MKELSFERAKTARLTERSESSVLKGLIGMSISPFLLRFFLALFLTPVGLGMYSVNTRGYYGVTELSKIDVEVLC